MIYLSLIFECFHVLMNKCIDSFFKVTNTARCMVEWSGLKHDVILSYLPLSHIAAQITDIWIALVSGSTVYFAQPNVLKVSFSFISKMLRYILIKAQFFLPRNPSKEVFDHLIGR